MIRQKLFSLQDTAYKAFQSKLIPTVDPERVIGVRTPELRVYAKNIRNTPEAEAFLQELPHIYYEEDNLHAFLLEQIRDYESCIREVNRFLPFIDNWATCDSLRPKCFGKHKTELLSEIKNWLTSSHTYTVRFGIGMLMVHFLDADYDSCYPEWVSGIVSQEYYVNMMIAWYFATALAKQYEGVLPYLEQNRLPVWVHNKTIQKAVESYRISPDQKKYLKSLKR